MLMEPVNGKYYVGYKYHGYANETDLNLSQPFDNAYDAYKHAHDINDGDGTTVIYLFKNNTFTCIRKYKFSSLVNDLQEDFPGYEIPIPEKPKKKKYGDYIYDRHNNSWRYQLNDPEILSMLDNLNNDGFEDKSDLYFLGYDEIINLAKNNICKMANEETSIEEIRNCYNQAMKELSVDRYYVSWCAKNYAPGDRMKEFVECKVFTNPQKAKDWLSECKQKQISWNNKILSAHVVHYRFGHGKIREVWPIRRKKK